MDDPCPAPLPPDLVGGLLKLLAIVFGLAALLCAAVVFFKLAC